MKVMMFPGQGIQREGMGKELYENFPFAKELFERANTFFGRRISDVMFYGEEIELLETINTQPAVYLYEVVLALTQKELKADCVTGHSLGEFAALVVNETITFEEGLDLVLNRAVIAQKVCESYDTAMGAVIGFSDSYIEKRINEISRETNEPIYVANYNGPGQVVITGSKSGIRIACKTLKAEGAKKAVPLAISGSFHSPYMEDASKELEKIITNIEFKRPVCPIYQCVNGKANTNPVIIKENLIKHITHPVNWTTMVNNMVTDGVEEFYEVGTDDTLQKIVTRMYPTKTVKSIWEIETYKNINPLNLNL
jgi:[acyl-carrier-protein] S-malonyltransferase